MEEIVPLPKGVLRGDSLEETAEILKIGTN